MKTWWLLVPLLWGCGDGPDSDGDGSPDDQDCAPDDASVHPGAAEICDTLDNDCDGDIDGDDDDLDPEGARQLYPDRDGDGFGSDDELIISCASVDGAVTQGGDCDDSDASIHPEAGELCDGIDNDCDGDIDGDDDDLSSSSLPTVYLDGDGDGYGGGSGESLAACDIPDGYITQGGDCDDADPAVNPDALETCGGEDLDCDGDPYTTSGSRGPVSLDGVPYTSLSAAIADAVSGDIIDVCPGIHSSSATLSISEDVHLRGAADAAEVRITATGSEPIITLEPGSALVLSDLNLTASRAGAIYAEQGGTLDITGCIFDNNEAPVGGAISSFLTDITITDSIFTDNRALYDASDLYAGFGGAITADQGTVSLVGVSFSGNEAVIGGAVTNFGATITADADTTFIDNEAEGIEEGEQIIGGAGGGIYAYLGEYILAPDTLVEGNRADFGGGVSLDTSDMSGGRIQDNVATYYAGGIDLRGPEGSVTGTVVDGNSAEYGGGALNSDAPARITLDRVDFTNNTASYGGGLYAFGLTNTRIVDCLFEDNSASVGNGAIFDQSSLQVLRTTWNNPSFDIYATDGSRYTQYNFGESASFSCNGQTCTQMK